MYCKNCGAPIPDGASRCQQCGSSLTNPQTNAAQGIQTPEGWTVIDYCRRSDADWTEDDATVAQLSGSIVPGPQNPGAYPHPLPGTGNDAFIRGGASNPIHPIRYAASSARRMEPDEDATMSLDAMPAMTGPDFDGETLMGSTYSAPSHPGSSRKHKKASTAPRHSKKQMYSARDFEEDDAETTRPLDETLADDSKKGKKKKKSSSPKKPKKKNKTLVWVGTAAVIAIGCAAIFFGTKALSGNSGADDSESQEEQRDLQEQFGKAGNRDDYRANVPEDKSVDKSSSIKSPSLVDNLSTENYVLCKCIMPTKGYEDRSTAAEPRENFEVGELVEIKLDDSVDNTGNTWGITDGGIWVLLKTPIDPENFALADYIPYKCNLQTRIYSEKSVDDEPKNTLDPDERLYLAVDESDDGSMNKWGKTKEGDWVLISENGVEYCSPSGDGAMG